MHLSDLIPHPVTVTMITCISYISVLLNQCCVRDDENGEYVWLVNRPGTEFEVSLAWHQESEALAIRIELDAIKDSKGSAQVYGVIGWAVEHGVAYKVVTGR